MWAIADDSLRVAGIAAETLGLPVGRVEKVVRLKGGLTNASWHVTAAGNDIVVRISTADEEALQIHRLSECRVLAAVEQAGLGPQVLRCDPAARVLVTRYIPGTVWTHDHAVLPENIGRIAGLLKALHALDIRSDVADTDLPAILRHYWASLARLGLPDPAGCWARDEMLCIAQELSRDGTRRLCHNDVHHLNVLDTGRLKLIDWEYAGIGSPWFDLASLSCNHRYDDAQRRHLLRAYTGRDDGGAAARLNLACRLFDYVSRLWQAVRGNSANA